MPAGTVIPVVTDTRVPLALARQLGLAVEVYGFDPPVWFITDRRTGVDRGSYCPATQSVHVRGVPGLFRFVPSAEQALRLFARENA